MAFRGGPRQQAAYAGQYQPAPQRQAATPTQQGWFGQQLPTMPAFPGGGRSVSSSPSKLDQLRAETAGVPSSDSDDGQEVSVWWPKALLVIGTLLLLVGLGLLLLTRPAILPPSTPPAPGPRPPGGLSGGPIQPKKLRGPGTYDLRALKGGRLLGCGSPIGLFPGNLKYGCAGKFATAQTCDAAAHPVKDTAYVKAVHQGCQTAQGRGTYGYAYDDGVGLKQCAPVTRYEWILCPTGSEEKIQWEAEMAAHDSMKRFRVTNRCKEMIWIQQAGAADAVLPGEPNVRAIPPGGYHDYAIPNKGLPSTRFLPKTGCDATGNSCDVQSMPPCPATGCDLPIDTKFESSWGCLYARATPEDKVKCSVTGQGNPSTYQDWWDGSAVDGWTLPFSVLVEDDGHGLTPGAPSDPKICSPVMCGGLDAERLCPREEFLTPEA